MSMIAIPAMPERPVVGDECSMRAWVPQFVAVLRATTLNVAECLARIQHVLNCPHAKEHHPLIAHAAQGLAHGLEAMEVPEYRETFATTLLADVFLQLAVWRDQLDDLCETTKCAVAVTIGCSEINAACNEVVRACQRELADAQMAYGLRN